MVEAKGKEKLRPNSLKRKSPGKRPMPSFSSQGNKLENTTTTKKIVNSQRNKAYSRSNPSHYFHAAIKIIVQESALLKSAYHKRWLRSIRSKFSGISSLLPTTSTLNNSPISAGDTSFCNALALGR